VLFASSRSNRTVQPEGADIAGIAQAVEKGATVISVLTMNGLLHPLASAEGGRQHGGHSKRVCYGSRVDVRFPVWAPVLVIGEQSVDGRPLPF